MENSKIEWTDHTFNPWIGCTKVSPGCAHCYAETLMDTRYGRVKWGKGNPRNRTSESNWRLPLVWNAHNDYAVLNHETDHRPRVFCASLADWLDDEVPIEWLADLLKLIHDTPSLDWLLLTKRPENWYSRLLAVLDFLVGNDNGADGRDIDPGSDFGDWLNEWLGGNELPANVWIGTSVEDLQCANERIPALLQIPARVRFLSCEPLLGAVDLTKIVLKKADFPEGGQPDVSIDCLYGWYGGADRGRSGIHWVICGGESGPGARPMHPAWARSLRDQCAAAGVPFLFKQWGDWIIDPKGEQLGQSPGMPCMLRVGKKAAGRLLDGVEHNGFPGDVK